MPLTRTGMVVGTAQYVSPEQAQGLAIEPSSDVYSLGVVGYEVLAGERPFAGDSTVSVALKHINETAPDLPDSVSEPMRQLIAICLRKDASARYPDGAALAAATVPVRDGQLPPDPAAGVIPVPPSLAGQPSTGEGSAAGTGHRRVQHGPGPIPTSGRESAAVPGSSPWSSPSSPPWRCWAGRCTDEPTMTPSPSRPDQTITDRVTESRPWCAAGDEPTEPGDTDPPRHPLSDGHRSPAPRPTRTRAIRAPPTRDPDQPDRPGPGATAATVMSRTSWNGR